MDRRSLLKILGLSPIVTLPVVAEAKLPDPVITTLPSSTAKILDVLEGQVVMIIAAGRSEGPGRIDLTRNGVAIHSVPVNTFIKIGDDAKDLVVLPTSYVTLDIPGPGRHEYVVTCTGGGTVDISADILSR